MNQITYNNSTLNQQTEHEKWLKTNSLYYQDLEKLFKFFVQSNSDVLEVKQMILDTKTHEATTNLSESFNHYDMSIVERDFDQLLEWENGISEEFSVYPKEKYKEGRLKFLESLLDKYPHNTENLLKLVDWVKTNY
jgi:predicted metal-dependent HD superfamily phosphohydrolase